MVLFDLEDLEGARASAPSGLACGRSGGSIFPTSPARTCIRPTCAVRSSRWTAHGPTARGAGAAPSGPGASGTGAAGRLTGMTVAVGDPAGTAARWGQVLGLPVDGGEALLRMSDGAAVRFVPAGEGGVEQVIEISVAVPAEVRAGRERIEIGAASIAPQRSAGMSEAIERLQSFDPFGEAAQPHGYMLLDVFASRPARGQPARRVRRRARPGHLHDAGRGAGAEPLGDGLRAAGASPGAMRACGSSRPRPRCPSQATRCWARRSCWRQRWAGTRSSSRPARVR